MPPSTPDAIVVSALFEEFRINEYPTSNVDDAFERYSASLVLKPREVTADELENGIVDGERDGGIDGFFVLLNGGLLSADDPILNVGDEVLRKVGARPELEVFLVQSKNRPNWEEATWEHLLYSLTKLLDAQAEDSELEKTFNSDVVEKTGIFRRAILSLGSKFPNVTFRAIYVAMAPEDNLTETLESRRQRVQEMISSLLTTGSVVTAEHLGVRGLYELAGKDFGKPASLKFRTLLRERDSFIGVAEIAEYLAFIRDDNDVLREELFDSNVRDFEGDNAVNEAIGETLAQNDDAEFWWLNNGVTVLGDTVDSPQQTLTIARPLIVNGLQTSHVLHNSERDGVLDPDRLQDGIVVRVVVSTDEELRDRIIAGTNRQTRVPTPALYATQTLQRDIERFLLVHGWYYERRKNRYKNAGKPAKQRVTINQLAQAMMSLMLAQPDNARARPSTVLSRREGYESIFPEALDRNAYVTAISVLRSVEDYLKTPIAKGIFDEYTNSRFYMLSGYEIIILGVRNIADIHYEHNFSRLKLPLDPLTLAKVLNELKRAALAFQAVHPKSALDAVFKSSEFRDQFFGALGVN